MRITFISDIHGVPSTLLTALRLADERGFDKLVLLGDLLYHGPRNGVPNFYDPVRVAEILNERKEQIIAVRGNCDAEVDQMMVQFPIMDDYKLIEAGKEQIFITHGHLYNETKLPPIGTVIVHGHTHIPVFKTLPCGIKIFNPGSVSLPKGGSQRSFGYFDGETFSHISFT